KYDRVIVVDGENWHNGVVGIVASRITERYGCPAIVISKNGESASGSGRSIEGFSLYNAIKYASDTLTKFGGHELAAGVSLKSDNIELFRQKINEYAAKQEYVPPVLKLDCRLNPSALSLDLAEALKELEPFGHGNPTPHFGVYGVTLVRITPIGGGKHLRLLFSKGENSFQALLFGMTRERFCFGEGDVLDAAVTVDTNLYNGELNLSVQVKALRMSGTDDERLFKEIDSLNNYMAGREFDVNLLLPSRAETGIIYKYITASPATEERIKYVHLSSVGYAKTAISLMTLTELGLISKDGGGVYRSTGVHTKTELTSSAVYKDLLERRETV
ncbi:MAG: DHHA1 domain-containing protein, partial [Acutalibacteraceae bacterium]|nr:DHHA1 domain-containing protein [Acutalibacteraceae bacterium]